MISDALNTPQISRFFKLHDIEVTQDLSYFWLPHYKLPTPENQQDFLAHSLRSTYFRTIHITHGFQDQNDPKVGAVLYL